MRVRPLLHHLVRWCTGYDGLPRRTGLCTSMIQGMPRIAARVTQHGDAILRSLPWLIVANLCNSLYTPLLRVHLAPHSCLWHLIKATCRDSSQLHCLCFLTLLLPSKYADHYPNVRFNSFGSTWLKACRTASAQFGDVLVDPLNVKVAHATCCKLRVTYVPSMGFAGLLGCALIAGGPGLAIFCTILARKSFLVLLVLAW